MNDYRILETKGMFYVQEKIEVNPFIKPITLIDFPFVLIYNYINRNKKSTYKWVSRGIFQKPFISIYDAKNFIDRYNKPDVIHDLS